MPPPVDPCLIFIPIIICCGGCILGSMCGCQIDTSYRYRFIYRPFHTQVHVEAPMQQRIQEMTWIKSDTYALVINPDETITIGFIDKK